MFRIYRRDYGFDVYIFRIWFLTIGTQVGNLIWSGFPFKPCTFLIQFRPLDFMGKAFEVEGRVFEFTGMGFWSALWELYDFDPDGLGFPGGNTYSHLCSIKGCNSSHTSLYHYPGEKRGVYLCEIHAESEGFCTICKSFIAGSGDESPFGGMCTDCYDEYLEDYQAQEMDDYGDPFDYRYDDPDDYLNDPYGDSWYDGDSGLADLEFELGNDSNGRYIGDGSEYEPMESDDVDRLSK